MKWIWVCLASATTADVDTIQAAYVAANVAADGDNVVTPGDKGVSDWKIGGSFKTACAPGVMTNKDDDQHYQSPIDLSGVSGSLAIAFDSSNPKKTGTSTEAAGASGKGFWQFPVDGSNDLPTVQIGDDASYKKHFRAVSFAALPTNGGHNIASSDHEMYIYLSSDDKGTATGTVGITDV